MASARNVSSNKVLRRSNVASKLLSIFIIALIISKDFYTS